MTTKNPLDSLLKIRDGENTARWNFYDAVGTPISSPGGIGNAAALTFSFLTTLPSYYSSSTIAGFTQFSELQKQAARDVLNSIANVVHISFSEVTGVGDMTFAMNANSGSSSYAYYPGFGYSYLGGIIKSVDTTMDVSGDVWFNNNIAWTADDFTLGGSGYGALIHEVGHALGLKHPFKADTSSGYILDVSLDNTQYTVMSYTQHPHSLYRTVNETSPGHYSWHYEHIQPETLMPLDIVALQYLYGANTSFHAGNDTYTFDTRRPFIRTIWDGDGKDTISISNFSLGSIIDLRDGYFSSISIPSDPLPPGQIESHSGIYDGTDNLGIANGSIIENAIGGNGDDQLNGNAVDNELDGRGGADTMTGGGGSDTLIGGAGNDVAVFGGAFAGYHLSYNAGVVSVTDTNLTDGNDGTDTLTQIETLRFTDRDFTLVNGLPHNAPVLNAFISAVAGNEGSEITVSFADLQNHGDEADIDGTVTAFVIKAISSGTLKIGTSVETATAWAAGTNAVVDPTHQAYWIPAANAGGTLNAFTAVAKDNDGLESATAIQATVIVGVDYPADNSTPANVSVGGSAVGTVKAPADVDWFKVTLIAGMGYQIDLEGSPTSQGTLPDPNIAGLYNSAGVLLSGTTDNDSGDGNNARVLFGSAATGIYYIAAGAYGDHVGSYRISVATLAVNHSPEGADKTVTLLEEATYTFAAADFGFSDPNDSPANVLQAVKITTLPGAGSLRLNGAAVAAGQSVIVADIHAGLLKFTPAANASGTNYAGFTFQVQDNGGIAIGGADLDTSPNTLSINVTAVNDAPTLTIFAAPISGGNEDSQITVTFTNLQSQGNETDVDGTVTAFVIKAISSGTLKIGSSANTATAWNAITNNTIDATHNAYWTPAANANGTLNAFTAVAKDNGGLESATAIQATVAVTAINDGPPVFETPTAINYLDTAFDDTFTTITGSLAASDSENDPITYGITGGIDHGDGTVSQSSPYGVLTVNKTTGAYDFMPNDAAIEALTMAASTGFMVTAWDGSLRDSKTLAINIAQKGRAELLGTESVGNDRMIGTSGDDRFDGLGGADTMTGRSGDDMYTVDNPRDKVIENIRGGIDTVISSISYALNFNVENLILSGTAALNGTGNSLNNILTGNAGANTLNGGAGADSLIGGLGNDVYMVDNDGDVVNETSTLADEIDTIKSSKSYTLGANLENLVLTGSAAIDGTGNGQNNILTGNKGANVLDGGAGDDTLEGGIGNDTLTGGEGHDIFQLLNSSKDTITDFSVDDDTIQLANRVFTQLTATDDLHAENFNIGAAAADANDYLIYDSDTGALYYDANGNDVDGATQIAMLGIGLALTHADFFVI